MNEQQARYLIKETFEKPFDKSQFINFIINLLNLKQNEILNEHPYSGNYIPEAYRQYINSLYRIAKYEDDSGKKIDVLIVRLEKVTSLERARSMQRNFIAWYLKGSRGGILKDAALVAFVSPDDEDWRFSFVKIQYVFEGNKVVENKSPALRYSFLVGLNEPNHTAQQQLVPLLKKETINFEDLEPAFNIETVTKEFFLKYRNLFLRTKEELDRIVKKDPKIKADFVAKGVDTVNFAKKLLGQIVFLYFLQKKGWFGVERDADWGDGSKQFLRKLFKKAHGGYTNFFNDILEPLFYEALRIDRSHDDGYYSRFNCKIPFLNGGLFDPIGNYDWVHTDILLPDELFSNSNKTKEGDTGDGILDIFDRYNFTVKEDEPLEKEVAIDPELLGKAYEKFNAIRPDNYEEFKAALKSGKKGEETKFNKKFGVYYTPREIVHYMCKQSLINYLHTKVTQAFLPVEITKQDIEDLIEVGEMITEHEATALIKEQNIKNGIQKSTEYTALLSDGIRQNAKHIDDWLADITVCDPAVGSGAFPVGMMNEIVRARNVLSVFLQCNTGIPACEGNTDIPVCDSDSVHRTCRNLPHWTKAGAVYWVTFRLADSLPQEKLNVWKAEREHWISRHPEPWSDEEWEKYNERFGETLEKWLDAGYGTCVLSRPELRKIVKDCLLRFDGERLHVHAAVIMPNHVHFLVEPLAGNILSKLLKGIKGASARQINQLLGKTGTKFWMDESYDHIVRSERQYDHFIKYIVDNPAKARLTQDKYWLYQCDPGIPARDNKTQTRMSVLRSPYEFKRRCIEHSLYGVDIDPGAVEIAKLRLWLSLVVDEESIKNIKPLPNLDYKIVCGNSLLGVQKDLFNHQLFNDLEKIKPLFFSETNPTKKQEYKKQIDDLIGQITKGHREFDFEVYFSEVFHNKGGFDVVIANPPYVTIALGKKQKFFSDNEVALLKEHYREVYEYKGNTFSLFFAKSISLLNGKGVLTFITPNTLLLNTTFQKTRKYILLNTNINNLVSIPNGVFESGETGGDLISILSKHKNVERVVKTIEIKNLEDFNERLIFNRVESSFYNEIEGNKFFLDANFLKMIKKLGNNTLHLGHIIKFYQGVITGDNSRFLSNKKLSNKHYKVLRGRDVHKYFYKFGGTYLFFEKELLWSNTNEDLFRSKEKLINRQTSSNLIAAYDDKGIFSLDSTHIQVLKNTRFNLKYILALFNSNLLNFYYNQLIREEGRVFAQVKTVVLKTLPIKNVPIQKQKPFICLVDNILSITKSDDYLQNPQKQSMVKELEREIDQMVYQLYGLTEEEIKIVENSIKKSPIF